VRLNFLSSDADADADVLAMSSRHDFAHASVAGNGWGSTHGTDVRQRTDFAARSEYG
jgi:hypothetical protein